MKLDSASKIETCINDIEARLKKRKNNRNFVLVEKHPAPGITHCTAFTAPGMSDSVRFVTRIAMALRIKKRNWKQIADAAELPSLN